MQNSPIALITGGGSGIGKAVALGLVDCGYQVIITGRRSGKLEETRSAASPVSNVQVFPADIGDPDAVDGLFDFVIKQCGRLDLLFNNAGSGAPPVPMETLSLDHWHRVVSVNLNGAYYCTRRAMGLMKTQTPQGGRIINNGSISAHVPRPHSAPYTATKHAITGLTRSTALDGRAFNIACGQIDIGNAHTDMTARMSGGVPQADGTLKPEPTMNVQAVVDAVIFMARQPLDTNVPFLTVMANQMPFIGRG
ncbi:MAG: SDR family NAD(P)-dependent oxidoreductase [Proteobacteria bacterium]|nr:SDR family NAD(P)-dependent oxidoreductase [Pseudomonadota bacterium]